MSQRIFLFFILLSSYAAGQTHDTRSALLEIGYGVAVPFGKYESVDVGDSASGYATSGTNLHVFFAYMVNDHAGIAGMVGSSVNRLNTEGLRNRYQLLADEIGGLVSDMQLAKWSCMGYMAGGYLTYPVQKVSVNFQLLAGYSRTEFPESEITVFTDTTVDAIIVNESASGTASAFCFTAGAGLKYNISELMCLSVNANFFSTYPEFETKRESNYMPWNDVYHKFHKRISVLNVTAGVGFRF